MANDIICEISSENELICEMSSAGEIVVEVNGMTYQSVAAELAEKASVEDVALKADKTYVDSQDSLKADKQQEEWVTPTLLNGWLNYTSTSVYYMKDSLGFVHLKGSVMSGTPNTNILKLPVGYRPLGGSRYFLAESNLTTGILYVDPPGNVLARVGNAARLSLDVITFKAEG